MVTDQAWLLLPIFGKILWLRLGRAMPLELLWLIVSFGLWAKAGLASVK